MSHWEKKTDIRFFVECKMLCRHVLMTLECQSNILHCNNIYAEWIDSCVRISITRQHNKLTRNHTIAAVCCRFYSAREDRRWPSISDYYTCGDRLSCAISKGLPVNWSMKTKFASLIQNFIHTCWLHVIWKTYTRTHCVISQKTVIFVDTGIRNSNLTCPMECYNKNAVTLTVMNTGSLQNDVIVWF